MPTGQDRTQAPANRFAGNQRTGVTIGTIDHEVKHASALRWSDEIAAWSDYTSDGPLYASGFAASVRRANEAHRADGSGADAWSELVVRLERRGMRKRRAVCRRA